MITAILFDLKINEHNLNIMSIEFFIFRTEAVKGRKYVFALYFFFLE